ncbi:MAG: DsrE family protein [Burkholderiaceae bacterium]|nr:DsrE family protein [Burkholderiaceae bacterium]
MKAHNIYQTILTTALLIVTAIAFSQNAIAGAESSRSVQDISASKKTKVVIQVSDNNPKKWNVALNNAENVQHDLGKSNVDIAIVAYGPGLPMLELQSITANRISNAIARGVKVIACENTMRKDKMTKDDMLPNLSYTKSGVVYLVRKEAEGYSYIKP